MDLFFGDAAVVDRVQEAVPRLGCDGQGPFVIGIGEARMHPTVDARLRDTDGGGTRDRDRQADSASFLNPRPARHLTIAVERVDAGRAGVVRVGFAARMNAGHTRAHIVALDHRRVANLNARHIRNRIPWAGRARKGNAEGAGAGLAGRGDELGITHAVDGTGLSQSCPAD